MEITREEVKLLAITVGVRQAARQLGLSEERVLKWSQRGHWFKQPDPIQLPPTMRQAEVLTVRKPSDVLTEQLADDSNQTKLSLSRSLRRGATALEAMPAEVVFTGADKVKHLVGSASQLHQWEAKTDSHQDIHIGVLANQAMIFQDSGEKP